MGHHGCPEPSKGLSEPPRSFHGELQVFLKVFLEIWIYQSTWWYSKTFLGAPQVSPGGHYGVTMSVLNILKVKDPKTFSGAHRCHHGCPGAPKTLHGELQVLLRIHLEP